jgi:ubiquitin
MICASPGACATAACDPVAGKCQTLPLADGTACDDNSVCTQGDTCKGGSCQAGAAIVCEDGNPCTLDGCDPVGGCSHKAADGAPCDDGSVCTQGDACKGGACQPGKSTCGCQTQADCDQQDDGNPCNGKLFCDQTAMPWMCKVKAGSAVTCLSPGPCTTSACDPKTGSCIAPPLPDATSCDADGSACTSGDHCQAGVCVVGTKTACDDGNPCTQDSCVPASGCVHVSAALPCEADGSACTLDSCVNGQCAVGVAKVCSDGNPCTQDACDPKTGACQSPAVADGVACDDGDPCSTGDHCIAGKCGSVTKKACDDGNVCTTDACEPGKGCASTPGVGPCTDNSVCTQGDACQGGTCKPGTAMACDDGDACTTDACDPAQGCTHIAVSGCSPLVGFTAVDANVVQPYCKSCHSSFVYKTLLVKALPSTSPCSVKKFVVPGQPMQSLWYLKIDPNATLPAGCGKHMPENKPALSPTQVQLVKDWIAGGAKP